MYQDIENGEIFKNGFDAIRYYLQIDQEGSVKSGENPFPISVRANSDGIYYNGVIVAKPAKFITPKKTE